MNEVTDLSLAQVLVIEDELEIRELISLLLLRQGFQVQQCESAMEAAKILQTKRHFDLIIVDWMLPELSGIDFIKKLREVEKNKIPILMVTAKTEAQDIIQGLESGADDYITKPFETSVFIARAKALIRRSQILTQTLKKSDTQSLGPFQLDFGTHEAKCNNETIHLTPSEFKIVSEMILSQGKVLTRDYLVKSVQGEGISVTERTIDTHIFGLRKKLGSYSDSIETIRGVGYRIKPNS